MTRQLIGWFLLLPLSVLLIVFALANRQLVVVNFNPLTPVDSLNAPGFGVPLFFVIYAVLLIGVLLGGVATWFAQGHHRIEKRQLPPRERAAARRPRCGPPLAPPRSPTAPSAPTT